MKKVLYLSILILLLLIIIGQNFYYSSDHKNAVFDEEMAVKLGETILEAHYPKSGIGNDVKLKAESYGLLYWKVTVDYEEYHKHLEEILNGETNAICFVDFGYTLIMRKKDGQIKLIRNL